MSRRQHGPLKGARRGGADQARGRPQAARPREVSDMLPTATPHAATPTSTPAVSAAGQPAAAGHASSGRPAHVVAVLPDSVEAVRVARTAAEHSLASHLPLVLVVPLPALGDAYDVEAITRSHARIREDIAAVAGRAQPALDLLGVSARVLCAPYRADPSASRSQLNMAAAVEAAARRFRSPAVIVSEAFPALAYLRVPAEILQVVERTVPAGTDPVRPGATSRPAVPSAPETSLLGSRRGNRVGAPRHRAG